MKCTCGTRTNTHTKSCPMSGEYRQATTLPTPRCSVEDTGIAELVEEFAQKSRWLQAMRAEAIALLEEYERRRAAKRS